MPSNLKYRSSGTAVTLTARASPLMARRGSPPGRAPVARPSLRSRPLRPPPPWPIPTRPVNLPPASPASSRPRPGPRPPARFRWVLTSGAPVTPVSCVSVPYGGCTGGVAGTALPVHPCLAGSKVGADSITSAELAHPWPHLTGAHLSHLSLASAFRMVDGHFGRPQRAFLSNHAPGRGRRRRVGLSTALSGADWTEPDYFRRTAGSIHGTDTGAR